MSLRLFLLDRFIRWRIKRRFTQNRDVLQLRGIMAAMVKRNAPPPSRIKVSELRLGDVPCERLAADGHSPTSAILYLHGGGFVAGSPATHRPLTWRLADNLGVPVVVPDYRLAPEHPFPAALDDVVAAYRALRASGATRIVVAGDSAGGNLTFGLVLRLKELNEPLPAALVCMSPVTELVADLPSHSENARSDAMFDPSLRAELLRHYCTDSDPAHPHVSPLRADVAGFPPTLIQCSRIEIVHDDSKHMADKLRAAKVEVSFAAWPRVYHVWQLSADMLPEARRAIADIVAFAKPHLLEA